MNQEFTLEADFPGGNILVQKITGNDVFLHQDLRDTPSWFYWAFRVQGAQRQRLTFHFTRGDVLGARGPAVSYDDGASWQWLGDDIVNRDNSKDVTFSHKFLPEHIKVLFAFCPVYTQANLNEFLTQYNSHAFLRREVLCKSRAGRDVEFLRIGNSDAGTKVLLTCRHHCCEATASWVLEGILEAVLVGKDAPDVILKEFPTEESPKVSNDALHLRDPSVAALPQHDDGTWLRANVDFAVIPFVDKDGVEAGDQGKNRAPHDHNRDYSGEIGDSIYPEVAALRRLMSTRMGEEKSCIVLDLHCPHIRGNGNEYVYFVGVPNQQIWQEVNELSTIWEKLPSGSIPFEKRNNLPFGEKWNTGSNYGAGKSCTKWASELPNVRLAAALEMPYANANGAEVTSENCRDLGRSLAKALREYIEAK